MGKFAEVLPRRINKHWGRRKRLLLCEDNGDGVIEDALSKHQHLEDRVNIQGVKDGDGRHGVHSWDQWAEGKATAREWKCVIQEQ